MTIDIGKDWAFEFKGVRYTNPVKVLTERDGVFCELPSGDAVDPRAWLLQHESEFILAGVVAYEFAWELDRIEADRRESDTPRIWVGAFTSSTEIPTIEDRDGRLTVVSLPDAKEYRDAVRRCVDAIFDGELFEVNHTARFRYRWEGQPLALLDAMSVVSSGDYIAALQTDGFAVVSMSPETFLRIEGGRIESRPIKGTRASSTDPDVDRRAVESLIASEKDRAENVMIVDLMRNDLARVCQPGSVIVSSLCHVESFVSLHHLVSVVEGQLSEGVTPMSAFLTCFPAGSITGAPKLRAIEVAATTESTPRGFYTGSFFVCSPDGRLDSSVAIRTATLTDSGEGTWDVVYGAGGAVVSDSDPAQEYDEAVTKSRTIHAVAER